MLSRRAVVLVRSHVEHSRDFRPHRRTGARLGVATLPEIAEHRSRGLLASVRAHEPEGTLPDRGRNWRAIEETRIVVAVTPRVRSGRTDSHQSAQNRFIVLSGLFLGRQILLKRVTQKVVGDRLSGSARGSGAQ